MPIEVEKTVPLSKVKERRVSVECMRKGKNLIQAIKYVKSTVDSIRNSIDIPLPIVLASKEDYIDTIYYRGLMRGESLTDIDMIINLTNEAVKNKEISPKRGKMYVSEFEKIREKIRRQNVRREDVSHLIWLMEGMLVDGIANIVDCEIKRRR
jgi:hypothetical protein